MKALPEPVINACYFDEGFTPSLTAMSIDWPDDGSESSERIWALPEGVKLLGPPPVRFGIRIHRAGNDAYLVCLLWNSTRLRWSSLTRSQLERCSLPPLMTALGCDMNHFLAQPILTDHRDLPKVA